MATPEDIEIATVAREVEAKREAESAPPQESMALATGSYRPNQSMVIEGELPYVPAAEAAAMSQVQPEYQGGFQMQPFPSQDFADRVVADISGPQDVADISGTQEPYTGPMSLTPLELDDFGVDAYQPDEPFVGPKDTRPGPEVEFEVSEETFDTAPVIKTNLTAPVPQGSVSDTKTVGSDKTVANEQKAIAKESLKYTKAAGGALRGYSRVIQSIKADAVLAQQAGAQNAEIQRGYQEQNQRNNQARIVELREQDKAAKKQMAEIYSAYDKIGDLKIDRESWWNSRTTGQKIAAAISLMISGYLRGKAGKAGLGPNNMIMNAIKDDIADQKNEYMAKKGKLADKKSLFATMMQQFGNTDKAHAAVEDIYLKDVVNKLQGIVTNNAGTQAAINAEKEIGIIQAKMDSGRADLYDKLLERTKKEQDIQFKAEDQEIQRQKFLLPLRDKYGRQLRAQSEPEAIAIRQSIGDSKHNVNTIDRMIKKIEAYGFGEWFKPSELKADLNAMSIILKGSLRVEVLGPGPVQEFEREILNDLVGDTGAITGPGKRAAIFRLRALQRESTLHYQEILKAKVPGYVTPPQRLQLKPVAKKQRK